MGHHRPLYVRPLLCSEKYSVFHLAITCPKSLSAPENGKDPECDKGNNYGSICTYTCETGFILSSATALTCGGEGFSPSGEWSADEPTCSRKQYTIPLN